MVQKAIGESESSLGVLIDRVLGGEEIIITRRGQPVARLVREHPAGPGAEAREAACAIRRLAEEARLGPASWEDWRAMRDEERR